MYSTGEGYVLNVLRTCSGFTSANTSQGNWKLLNDGKAAVYGILRPGPFSIEWITMRKYIARWTTVIEVWQKYTVDGTTQTNLYANVANVITGFLPERLINDSTGVISDSSISGGEVPQEMWRSDGGGPAWLRWSLNFVWTEEVQITFTD